MEKFVSVVRQATAGRVVVLCYHGVPDVQHPWVNVDPVAFREQMHYLKANGYKVIAMRDLTEYIDVAQASKLPPTVRDYKEPGPIQLVEGDVPYVANVKELRTATLAQQQPEKKIANKIRLNREAVHPGDVTVNDDTCLELNRVTTASSLTLNGGEMRDLSGFGSNWSGPVTFDGNTHISVYTASACSSARILLNSKSKQHPNGLGNSSNMVGKYLHDSTGSSRAGFIPGLMNRKMYNEDGVGGMHVYTPWWLDNKNLDFPRGYHIEVWGGIGMPNYGFGFNPNDFNKFFGLPTGGYGAGLRDDVKKYYGSVIGFGGRGEAIAREDNYCEIDPTTVDEFGIPVLRFNYKWSDFERNQARHMQSTFEELIHGMGGEPLGDTPTKEQDYGLLNPGQIIHEVGTTRMGDDTKRSVVNRYQQLHDVNNVFITDAGPFVSQADKNCTWTILALSWRASDYIVEQLKQQNI